MTSYEMFRRRPEIRERLLEIVERFRQRGATSSEKAMTPEELGLPPRFKDLMSRQLRQSDIFVEVNGRYYLSEKRLGEIQGPRRTRKKLLSLRILRIFLGILFISLLWINLFVKSPEIRLISSAFLILMLGICVLQIYYLIRARRRL